MIVDNVNVKLLSLEIKTSVTLTCLKKRKKKLLLMCRHAVLKKRNYLSSYSGSSVANLICKVRCYRFCTSFTYPSLRQVSAMLPLFFLLSLSRTVVVIFWVLPENCLIGRLHAILMYRPMLTQDPSDSAGPFAALINCDQIRHI